MSARSKYTGSNPYNRRAHTPHLICQLQTQDASSHWIKTDQISSFMTKLKAHSASPQPVDILLTHCLPQLLTVHSKLLPKNPTAPAWGCAPITEVLRNARPRYHFAGGSQPQFWEREPWVWDQPGSQLHPNHLQVTRFVNLGEFGNKDKERVRDLCGPLLATSDPITVPLLSSPDMWSYFYFMHP